jgi:hypothetical protein
MRFLPVNDLAMASPQSDPNRSMPGERLRRRAETKDDESQQVRTRRTPAFRPWRGQAGRAKNRLFAWPAKAMPRGAY